MYVVLFEFQVEDFSTLKGVLFIFRVLICELLFDIVALVTVKFTGLIQVVPSAMENRYS